MLPDWAQTLSFINPIYHMINGIRYTVLGVSDSEVMISIMMAIVLHFWLYDSFNSAYEKREKD